MAFLQSEYSHVIVIKLGGLGILSRKGLNSPNIRESLLGHRDSRCLSITGFFLDLTDSSSHHGNENHYGQHDNDHEDSHLPADVDQYPNNACTKEHTLYKSCEIKCQCHLNELDISIHTGYQIPGLPGIKELNILAHNLVIQVLANLITKLHIDITKKNGLHAIEGATDKGNY